VDAVADPLEGGGPDPAGTQCGVPPGPGGGPDPAGTQCGKDPLDRVAVAGPLTLLAVPYEVEDGLARCGEEFADAGHASHRLAARAAPASDPPATTRRRRRTLVTFIIPPLMIGSDKPSMRWRLWLPCVLACLMSCQRRDLMAV
jgi:hypothetical protein